MNIQQRFLLLILTLLLILPGCSVLREAGGEIVSVYANRNRLIEGAYTHFYNDSLQISEDLYAVYAPTTQSYTLPLAQLQADKKMAEKAIGVTLAPAHFVFQLQGKFGSFATRFYFLPNHELPTRTIREIKYKNSLYTLYSLPSGNGQIIQLFSIRRADKGNHKEYANYRKECDAIIQKLCYGDYYKIVYPDHSTILINLANSRFREKKITVGMLADTTLLNTKDRKIISIPANREALTVRFQLAPAIQQMIVANESLSLEVYDKQQFATNPSACIPILRQPLKENRFSLNIDISYNEYMILVTDSDENVIEALCFNVW